MKPRYHKPQQSIKEISKSILENIADKQGLTDFNMFLEWESIVGSYWSNLLTPERISFPKNQKTNGTLYIKTTSSGAQLAQHSMPQLISKLNSYFGYKAIVAIKTTIWPLKKTAENDPFLIKKHLISDERKSKLDESQNETLRNELAELLSYKT